MANVARAEEQATPQGEAHEKDAPLLDLSDAAVKRLIKTARSRGFVTLDQLNAVLPSQEVSPDQIEDTMSMLSDMGITVVESEDPEEPAAQEAEEAEEDEPASRAVTAAALPTGRGPPPRRSVSTTCPRTWTPGVKRPTGVARRSCISSAPAPTGCNLSTYSCVLPCGP